MAIEWTLPSLAYTNWGEDYPDYAERMRKIATETMWLYRWM